MQMNKMLFSFVAVALVLAVPWGWRAYQQHEFYAWQDSQDVIAKNQLGKSADTVLTPDEMEAQQLKCVQEVWTDDRAAAHFSPGTHGYALAVFRHLYAQSIRYGDAKDAVRQLCANHSGYFTDSGPVRAPAKEIFWGVKKANE